MAEQAEIDGYFFDVKVDGMTLVDAYYIPDEDVEEYVRDRELYAEKATQIFSRQGAVVTRDFQNSQDGEAIVGRYEDGDIAFLVHLDPTDIRAMKEADALGRLEEFLLMQLGDNPYDVF